MVWLMFFILQGISLLFYGVVVALSIVPADPARANHNLYVIFIIFGGIFYLLGASVQTWLTLLICESVFDRTGKKLALLVLPVLLLAYIVFVIITGS